MTDATSSQPELDDPTAGQRLGLPRLLGTVLLAGMVFYGVSYLCCMPSFLFSAMTASAFAAVVCTALWTRTGTRIAAQFFFGLTLIHLLNRIFSGLDDLFRNPPFWSHLGEYLRFRARYDGVTPGAGFELLYILLLAVGAVWMMLWLGRQTTMQFARPALSFTARVLTICVIVLFLTGWLVQWAGGFFWFGLWRELLPSEGGRQIPLVITWLLPLLGILMSLSALFCLNAESPRAAGWTLKLVVGQALLIMALDILFITNYHYTGHGDPPRFGEWFLIEQALMVCAVLAVIFSMTPHTKPIAQPQTIDDLE